jgi:hypothetical protein
MPYTAQTLSSANILGFQYEISYLYPKKIFNFNLPTKRDRLCGLVVRVLGYRSGGPGSIPGTNTKKKILVGLERGALSLVSTTEELLDRKVAAPV